ncbi:hypothetical protein R1sor_009282 [Riccia sorocarpa]|uniref:Uncharacterized protein n=1 Tax=Riccia sorocarpa TaxID=122646 RepID=A0ABD3HW94_9MARC
MRESGKEAGERGRGISEQKGTEKEQSLALEKKAPRGCTSFLLCCCTRPHNQASVREMDKEEAITSAEVPMVSSAAMPLPPPLPVTAFMDCNETVQPSNGHSTGAVPVQPQLKLPLKSNLRRHSMFAVGSPQHQPALRHSRSQGSSDQNGSETDGANGQGNAPAGQPQRQTSKVRWTDSHGKDLTEVWEFEPSEAGDSDDEDTDSDSSQACTCVIQ